MEHKFRGKPVAPTKYGTDFVYGSKVECEGKVFIVGEKCEYDYEDDIDGKQRTAIYGDIVEVHPDSVGMWTGLKDESDVEIYEGDIVEAVGQEVVKITQGFRRMKSGIYNFVVFWSESFAGWGFRHPIGSIHPNVGIREYKVIGNTTDNPELLESAE